MPDADVIFTSSPLTADDIATLPRTASGSCATASAWTTSTRRPPTARGIPIWNCPTSNNEEVSDHAVLLILAAQRRLLPFAHRRARGRLGRLRVAAARRDPPPRDADGRDHRARADRPPGGPKLHGFRPTVIAYDPFIDGTRDPEVELVSLDELCARGRTSSCRARP